MKAERENVIIKIIVLVSAQIIIALLLYIVVKSMKEILDEMYNLLE